MRYGYQNTDGKVSIDSVAVFCDALQNRNPLELDSFIDFFNACEALVLSEFKATQGAINNVRGNWYEWLISIGSLHYVEKMPNSIGLFVQLPNVRSLDYMSLYESDIYKYIEDLKQKTSARGVSLISSNPDYAIIRRTQNNEFPDLSNIDAAAIARVDNYHKQFLGNLDFEGIIGFASIKTSLRPDRRLQLSHEGALVKAFYEHLKGRLWKVDARGLKYYGVATEVKESDIEGLRTVATHSILSVNTKPEAAVDEVFQITSGSNLSSFLDKVLF